MCNFVLCLNRRYLSLFGAKIVKRWYYMPIYDPMIWPKNETRYIAFFGWLFIADQLWSNWLVCNWSASLGCDCPWQPCPWTTVFSGKCNLEGQLKIAIWHQHDSKFITTHSISLNGTQAGKLNDPPCR